MSEQATELQKNIRQYLATRAAAKSAAEAAVVLETIIASTMTLQGITSMEVDGHLISRNNKGIKVD